MTKVNKKQKKGIPIRVINANDINIWRVQTKELLTEVLNNPGTAILAMPINIFGKILAQVSERTIKLNDKELNKLMIRLCLYESATPGHPEYEKTLEYLNS